MSEGRFVQSLEPRRLMASGLFTEPIRFGDRPLQALTTGDFNGDGAVDIAAVGTPHLGTPPPGGTECYLYVLLNDGAGGFAGTFSPIRLGTPDRIVAAHLDDDGFEDLVVLHTQYLVRPRLTTHRGLGDGRFEALAAGAEPPVTRDFGAIASGDFDGDGRRELVAGGTIYYRSGAAFTPLEIDVLSAPHVADMNGDGRADLLGDQYVWLNDGAGRFVPPPANFPRFGGHSEVRWAHGDFNNDGHVDLVSGGPASQGPAPQVYINRGDNTFDHNQSLYLRLYPSVPAVGDFNGDGFDDIALGRGYLAVILGRGDGTFRPAGADVSTGDLVALDLNADGRTDLIGIGGLVSLEGGAAISIRLAADVPEAPAASFGDVGGVRVPAVNTPSGGPPDHRPAAIFALKGPGTGRIYDSGPEMGWRLELDGTTAASSLLVAPRAALFGDFDVAGTARNITLGGATGGSRLTIAGAGVPTALTFTTVRDLSVTTQSPISRLLVHVWQDTDRVKDVIAAPAVGSIVARAPRLSGEPATFSPDVTVTGGGMSIRSIDVRGQLSGSVIRTAGSIGSVRATTFSATIFAGVNPSLTLLPTAAADFVTRASIGSVRIGSSGFNETFFGGRVAAWSIGSFQPGIVSDSAFGDDSGVAAVSVGSYNRGGANPKRLRRVTTPGVFDSFADFQARVVAP